MERMVNNNRKENNKDRKKGRGKSCDNNPEVKQVRIGLLELFEQQIKRYKKHLFLIGAQYGYFTERRDTLKDNQCIVHVDVSENYVCKLGTEIQSMHFGASKRHITLHTGVYYAGINPKPKTFCTVSESLNHGPPAT